MDGKFGAVGCRHCEYKQCNMLTNKFNVLKTTTKENTHAAPAPAELRLGVAPKGLTARGVPRKCVLLTKH